MTRILPAFLLAALASSAALADQPSGQISPTAPQYYDFTFIFRNVSYDEATVTGIVRGLAANGTSAAYSVEITATSGAYGEGQYIGTPFNNTWTLSNGAIQSVEFFSLGLNNSAPAVTDGSLMISSQATSLEPVSAALSPQPNGVGISSVEESLLTFRVLRSYDVLPTQAPETTLSGAADLTQSEGVEILNLPGQIRLQSQ